VELVLLTPLLKCFGKKEKIDLEAFNHLRSVLDLVSDIFLHEFNISYESTRSCVKNSKR
jgi:hypothetical protein